MLRASVSASTSRLPPRQVASGSSAAWRWMPHRRSRCGTTRPTKPIAPPSRTAATVATVAQPKASGCRRVTATPSERALSSPSASTSSDAACDTASAAQAASAARAGPGSPAGDRSPKSQNSMPCSCAEGASDSSRPTIAPKPEDRATPARRTRYGFQPEGPSENAHTVPAASAAPAKAERCRPANDAPRSIAPSAPAEAPPETPRMKGSARGLRSSTCSRVPASASRPPQANAASARGARTPQTISCASSSPRHTSASASRAAPRSTLPHAMARARLAGTSAITTRVTTFTRRRGR